MLFSLSATALLAASVSIAAPVTSNPLPPYGAYVVSAYSGDDIGGELFFNFDLAYAPDVKYQPPYAPYVEPAIRTSCSGTTTGGSSCGSADVTANVIMTAGSGTVLTITHTWLAPGPNNVSIRYWDTGRTSVPSITGAVDRNFTMYATDQVAIPGNIPIGTST